MVAERISGSLRGVDQLFQETAARSLDGTNPADLLALMSYRSGAFPEVRTVFLIGTDGRVKLSTLASMVGVDLRNRPYFEAATKAPFHAGLIVAPPTVSPITGRLGLVVARPIISPVGTFAGVVAAALNPEFFSETLSGVVEGEIDRAVITNLDGDVLARLPDPGRHMGSSIRSGPLFTQHLPKARTGTFIAPSIFDGMERLASYQVLERHPIVISVGITTRAALRRWTINTLIMGGAGLLFSALLLAATILLERRERERHRAEAALKASEESYRILVNDQDDLIHRYAPDTTLLTVNRAYARFYGEQPDQLIGRKHRIGILAERHIGEGDGAGRKQRNVDVAFQHDIEAGDVADLGLGGIAHGVERHEQRDRGKRREAGQHDGRDRDAQALESGCRGHRSIRVIEAGGIIARGRGRGKWPPSVTLSWPVSGHEAREAIANCRRLVVLQSHAVTGFGLGFDLVQAGAGRELDQRHSAAPFAVDTEHPEVGDDHVDHAGASQRQRALVQELGVDAAVLVLGRVLHDHHDLLDAGDQVHGTAHALHHLAGDHPVGEVAILADLHGAEQREVDVAATDHREAVG